MHSIVLLKKCISLHSLQILELLVDDQSSSSLLSGGIEIRSRFNSSSDSEEQKKENKYK